MAVLTDVQVLSELTDEQVLTLTMLREAAGDDGQGGSSVEERIAVGVVVRNRVKTPNRFGRTYKTVCLKRKQGPDTPENDRGQYQFSCWDLADPNRARAIATGRVMLGHSARDLDPVVRETLYLARGIMSGVILDRIGGADHYYNPNVVAHPAWAYESGAKGVGALKNPLAVVGSHRFLKA